MSNSTQNDWEIRIQKFLKSWTWNDEVSLKEKSDCVVIPREFLASQMLNLLADARKEVLAGVLVEMDKAGQGYASGDYVNGWSDCRTVVAERHRVLATLREEEGKK